jgi:hypothetical protein
MPPFPAKSQVPKRGQKSLNGDAQLDVICSKNDVRNARNVALAEAPDNPWARFLAELNAQSDNYRGVFGNAYAFELDTGKRQGPPLPKIDQGCMYLEFQVGEDREGGAGRKRIVILINTSSLQIEELYYTDEHYEKFTFFRIKN